MSPTSPPRRVPELASAQIDGTTIVFDPHRAMAHRLNETAGALWDLIDGERTGDELVTTLCARYDAPVDTVTPAVTSLLDDLTELGLLMANGDEAGAAADVVVPELLEAEPPAPPEHEPSAQREDASDGQDADAAERLVGPFDSLGFVFDVCGPAEPVEDLGRSWALLASDRPAAHHYVIRPTGDDDDFDLLLDGERLTGGPVGHVAAQALWHVNHETAMRPHADLLVHASAVLRDDDVVFFAGDMNAGKSTLVTALAARGWPYVTDEAVAIDVDDLRATAYPKPIGLDPGSWPLFPEFEDLRNPHVGGRWWVRADELPEPGGRVATNGSAHRVAGVVVISFDPEAEEPTVQQLSPADAVFALIPNLFNLARHNQRGLDALISLAGTVPVHRMVSGTLDGSIRTVEQLLHDLP